MGPITYIAVYAIIWWTVLFAILPLGVRSQLEEGDVTEGSEPGAPARPRHLYKFALTTLVSAVVWGVFFVVSRFDLFQIVPGR